MAIRVVRLGEARLPNEGLRVGTVRRPPRGVKKEDFGRLDYFDVWLPELSPPPDIVSWALSEPWTDKRWAMFARKYRAQMAKPDARQKCSLMVLRSLQFPAPPKGKLTITYPLVEDGL